MRSEKDVTSCIVFLHSISDRNLLNHNALCYP
nr:MAG TPA: hypothetical protein [Caudoviricetes sp.]